jgi:hypothetical protein
MWLRPVARVSDTDGTLVTKSQRSARGEAEIDTVAMLSKRPAPGDREVPALSDTLLNPAVAASVQADVRALVDAEVSDKKGASGLALKAGYGAVKKVHPTVVEEAIDKMWPAFVWHLDSFWQEWSAAPSGTFSDYLVARQDAAAEALLSVTDERVEITKKTALRKAYGSLRGTAKKHVVEALPRVGEVVQKHAG